MEKYIYPPIYIAGPTASGKSKLSLMLADLYDSVIISADSMQIYRNLDIGTAKVSDGIRKKYVHKLIDVVDYKDEFSVAEFAEIAKKEIENAQKEGKLPIIVGGTGLYFESLLYPMSFSHTIKNSELREQLTCELNEKGPEFLHEKLKDLDPETAERLHVNDTKRIIRALEIILSTNKTLKENSDTRETPDVIMICLNTDRAKLYERINERVDEMFDAGLINEIKAIDSFNYQSMQAIGYKEFKDYDINNLTQENINEIKENIKQHSRNYAKRQLTWFRKYDFVNWFDCTDMNAAIEFIKTKIDDKKQQLF